MTSTPGRSFVELVCIRSNKMVLAGVEIEIQSGLEKNKQGYHYHWRFEEHDDPTTGNNSNMHDENSCVWLGHQLADREV